ncbi:MAG: acyl carrier protein [Elusimicrobia bacterium]|nr:acyl carrier protein [Elusimicrobiota bacterium]
MQDHDLSALESELKGLLIEALELPDIQPKDIDSTQPLFVEGLGLDSIDALELAIVIGKKYRIQMDGDVSMNIHHFASVRNLAVFVAENRRDTPKPPLGG